MNITVTIQAPELAKAIESLALAISSTSGTIGSGLSKMVEEGMGYPPPVQAAPVQQFVPPAPVQQPVIETPAVLPTAPIQAPVQPIQAPIAPVQQQAVPTTAPTYTMEQLAVAATQIVDAGRRNELVQLLSSFGVQALTGLPKEQYGAFATKLREMGAKI